MTLVLETIPELLIVQLKEIRKVENSIKKISKRIKLPLDETVVRNRNFELEEIMYHL